MVDDADNSRIGWHFRWEERKAGFLAAHEEDRFTDAGADCVHGHQRTAGVRTIGCDRLQHEQRDAREVFVFTGDDDVADDLRQLHQSPDATSTASTMPTMAASIGQSFIPEAMRAELPLTMSTVSPTPASTVSTATR